jgi:hypothetical protein
MSKRPLAVLMRGSHNLMPIQTRILIVLLTTLVRSVMASPYDSGERAASRVDASVNAAGGTAGSATLTPFPSTPADLISNLLYVAEHDIVFQGSFYSTESLRRLLGASHIQGQVTEAGGSMVVELASLPGSVARGPHDVLPGGSILLRSDGSRSMSINLQINDPEKQPGYDDIDRIVGGRWVPVTDNFPKPHARYVAPTAPHGNAHMKLDVMTNVTSGYLEAFFGQDGKLLDFFVLIERSTGRQ